MGILAITGWMTFGNGPEELPEMSDISAGSYIHSRVFEGSRAGCAYSLA